jgi:hypothetical protein
MRPYTAPALLAIVALIVTASALYMLPGLIRLAPRLSLFEAVAFFALHAGLIFGGLALFDTAATHADRIKSQLTSTRRTR